MSDRELPEAIERRVLEILRGPEEGRDAAFAELYRGYPDLADGIRSRLVKAEEIRAQLAGAAFVEAQEHPQHIGPFDILRVLGEGGMGTVYLAEQREPLQRQVALKVIKLGMDTRRVLSRFEAERQALALMDHPSIARVLEAGATEQGRPYFAMEYVQGDRITDHCDRQRLGIGERLTLFGQVCEAVQHAHQKGVIHRDLKPSNVLVVEVDGKPMPKVIDFGLARAIDQRLTAETLLTVEGAIVGTPEYMSPEQATSSGADIDTRTDVYALGVMLYELLAGALPLDLSRTAGVEEIRRRIRDDRPSRPSSRISESIAVVAERRRTDVRGLVRSLRGELDIITIKALEKDRDQRYQSPGELAADVGRYLRHEPVLASPPGVGYRLRKFVRRYRLQVSAVAAVFAVLLAGGVISTLFAVRAEDSLARFNLLANGAYLQEAIAAADELHPAWPENADDIRSWILEQGEPLAEQLPILEAALLELRGRASDWTEEQRARDRQTHPDLPRLEQVRTYLEYVRGQLEQLTEGDGEYQAQAKLRDTLVATVAELEEAVATRRTWRLPVKANQFLLNTLVQLVENLKAFGAEDGLLAEMRQRLTWAETVAHRTLDAYRTEWAAACAAIRASDDVQASRLYGGFELAPQVGLVPIGMDPESKMCEFVHFRSGTEGAEFPERDPETDRLVVTGDTGIVFVLIPGGTFSMGAQRENPQGPNYDPQAEPAESPVHEVTLTPYFLGKHEMTQGQWKRLSGGDEPSVFRPGRNPEITLANPVEYVSWEMCDTMLRRYGLALPTEAQWECGARSGTSTPWWTGPNRESLIGAVNLADQTAKRAGSTYQAIPEWPELEDGFVRHAEVHTLRPNHFGLHHVHGNVWEWCQDWFETYGVTPLRPGDGLRRHRGFPGRIGRGAAFMSGPQLARVSRRNREPPTVRGSSLGVRPARLVIKEQ